MGIRELLVMSTYIKHEVLVLSHFRDKEFEVQEPSFHIWASRSGPEWPLRCCQPGLL